MAKKKEEIVEEAELAESKGESKAKAEFRRIIEVYKVQNPVKFALKKAELERKLAAL